MSALIYSCMFCGGDSYGLVCRVCREVEEGAGNGER